MEAAIADDLEIESRIEEVVSALKAKIVPGTEPRNISADGLHGLAIQIDDIPGDDVQDVTLPTGLVISSDSPAQSEGEGRKLSSSPVFL